MGITMRVETFDRDLALLIDETLSPEARSEAFGRAAREIIVEQDRDNDMLLGRDVSYRTYVDGRESPLLETAEKRIVAEWDMLEAVFSDVHAMLLAEAPVLTGAYARSITLFADFMPVPTESPPPESDVAEYFFAATVPYARKIERGYSSQAPDGVFEGVAALAQKRFGSIARIRYSFRTVIGGLGRAYLPGEKRGSAQHMARQPAIIITPRSR